MRNRNTPYQTAFGEALSKQLSANQTTANALADSIGVSPAFVSRMMTADRKVSPQWADLIADVMKLNEKQTAELHTAAALDAGYKLDLTKKKTP